MSVSKKERKAQKKAYKKARRKYVQPFKFLAKFFIVVSILLTGASVVVPLQLIDLSCRFSFSMK